MPLNVRAQVLDGILCIIWQMGLRALQSYAANWRQGWGRFLVQHLFCSTIMYLLLTDLLRCNSHTMKFTHLKCIQFDGFWYIHRYCAIVTIVNFRTFTPPQEENPGPFRYCPSPYLCLHSTTNPLFVSKDLPILDISPKCHHVNMWPFVTGSLHLACCFQASSM